MTMSNNPEKSILVVEDEPSLVFTLQDTLENEGYQVHVVSDGEKAIEKVKDVSPDLLLLDLMLPGKVGMKSAKRYVNLNTHFPL